MKSVIAVLLVALIVEVNSVDAGVKNVEVSDSINSPLLQSLREKRSIGASRDIKEEWELKNKDGSSLRVSKSVSHSDGGLLQMLPALHETKTKDRIKILNQLQNGQGRPEVAQQMLSEAPVGDLSSDSDIESRHTRSSASSDVSTGFLHPKPTIVDPVPVQPVDPVPVQPVDPVPVQPVDPVPVQPVVPGGVCCSPPVAPVGLVAVHKETHLQKLLQKSVDYHRRKQELKQALLDKVAAKHTSLVAVVPAPLHVHDPHCEHPAAVAPVQSRHQALKELIAYKKEVRAQRFREKLAAIHAQKAVKPCPTCCCN